MQYNQCFNENPKNTQTCNLHLSYLGEITHDHQGPKLKCVYLLEFEPCYQTICCGLSKELYPSDDLFL